MADRYWVGGAGTWDATTTTNWSATSGGAGGASAPTSADNVFFNTSSNLPTNANYAVTVGTNANAQDITIAGPGANTVTITSGATAVINCYGSWTSASTGVVFTTTSGATINFLATTTGKTITTNNVTLGAMFVVLNGVGGEWTLGSAFTATNTFTVTAGAFSTSASNYAFTPAAISSSNSNIRSISLNASTVTMTGGSPLNFATATNLTFSAGTSTITCTNASPTLTGGTQTFYNVTFSSTATGTTTISGANTFNVLTQAAIAAAGLRFVTLGGNQTIATLTLSAGASAVTRTFVRSDTIGTQRTLTVATLTAISDVDFRDIVAAGASAASPWTGTRLGNCKNNSNITFAAGTDKYWSTVSGASASWSGTAWATSTGGAPALNNFPLAQDTCIIDDSGATTGNGLRTGNTVTIDALWNMGTLNFSGRTAAFNWTQANQDPVLYGNVTLTTAMTMVTVTGSPTWTFSNQGTVQALNSAGITLRLSTLTVNSPGGGVSLTTNTTLDLSPIVAPNVTGTFVLSAGTLNLSNNTLTTVGFSSSGTGVREIAFGTGKLVVNGSNATVFNTDTGTNLTSTGSRRVEYGYNGSVGLRQISGPSTATTVDGANVFDHYILSGTDGFNPNGARSYGTVDFTGFGGVASGGTPNIYGDLVLSSIVGFSTSALSFAFAGASGSKSITTNGKAIDGSISFSGVGRTWQLQDDLTLSGASRTVTLIAGTLNLVSYTLNSGAFSSTNSNTRTLAFGTGKLVLTTTNASVWNSSVSTGFTMTGTRTVEVTGNGLAGETRSMSGGAVTSDGSAANAANFYIKAGADTLNLGTANRVYGTLDFTGFSGQTQINASPVIYGDLVLSTGMTVNPGVNVWIFAATTSQTITSNGKTIDVPITFNGIGGTWTMQDAFTGGSTQILTFTNGTIKLKNGVTSTVGTFATSGTNQKFLQSSTPGSQATLSQAAGTVSVSYLTIQDSVATGGATWIAYVGNLNVDAGNNTGWVFFNNVYTRTVVDSATVTDLNSVSVVIQVAVADTATLSDSTSSAFLWNLIDDAQTPNWQNINNDQLPGWQDIDTL